MMGDIFSIFYNMKVYCVFSESPHQGDSNGYTKYTIFHMNRKNTLNYLKSAALGFFSKGLKNEFETAVVNEPSVFEPLKFYCMYYGNSKSKASLMSACLRILFLYICSRK